MKLIFKSSYTKDEAASIWKEWKQFNKEIYKNLKEECRKCGVSSKLTINHIDGDKTNNLLNNLECLCWKCHKYIHNVTIGVIYRQEENKVNCSFSCEWDVAELLERYEWKSKRWILRKGFIEL